MSEIDPDIAEDLPEGAEPPEPAPQVDPEAEADARKYGWKPKEEFTLDPEGWVSADRFLELPSTQRKMTQDINRRLEKELKDRDERLERIQATSAEAVTIARRQERERYEAQLAQIAAEKRQAVEVGDGARYDQLTVQERQIRPPAIDQAAPSPQVHPVVAEAIKATPWMQDPDAYRFAQMAINDSPEVQRLPAAKQIAWAEKKVREHFPEHFPEQPVKPQFSKVDGGGLGHIGKRGKGPDDLPAEARKVGQDFVTEGIFKSLDEYAASYFAQEKRA
jgi:hypothetical protein